jgi:hypothetical protein
MKKTIVSLALIASATSAHALMATDTAGRAQRPVRPTYKVCVSAYANRDGSISLGSCNKTPENIASRLPIFENGCARGQAAFTVTEVTIPACPSFVQL